MAQTTFYLT